ncbi:hypothetical protein [Catenuloplanes japonicus]|uniref:hypothetical protein n=1 Tax=Catenuloplanes japonicus TaxID=33876 RepID=UPI00052701BF|nr:hypothetical protein [Catenuloplanes japonicus]
MTGPTIDHTDAHNDRLIRTAADLTGLADRIDASAAGLAFDAEHATTALDARGHGDLSQDDQDAWAGRHADAALAAAQYADRLRDQASTMDAGAAVPDADYAQAETVAAAADLNGILIDGRSLAEHTIADGSPWHTGEREAWDAGEHPAQVKAATVEATGAFTHIAELGQVPFWQLTPHTDANDADEA